MMLKPIQISASAPIIPIMRVSTSVALSNRRIPDSVGATLVALGDAEVMIPPDPLALRRRRHQAGAALQQKAAPPSRTARPLLFHCVAAGSTQPQNFTVPGFTPAQTSALVIQPLSTITLRFSLVTGSGVSRMPLTLTPLAPPVNGFTSGMAVIFLPSASATAASPEILPRSRASFQIETVWVPSAMRLIAAWSPSWPDTGTEPA